VSLTEFAKPRAASVMGIDASTHSIAFAVIKNGQLTKVGEIQLQGDNFYDRLIDCRRKSDAILGNISVDYVGIEKAIRVKSTDVALKLGMIVGIVISSLGADSVHVEEIAPISWQAYIGNPNIAGKKKKEIATQFPDRSTSWLNNHIRGIRKQRTIDWVKTRYNKDVASDNVADSIGIATYVAEQKVS
jgi:Holliday junction resolvasome RuvABC endonuclease subunit